MADLSADIDIQLSEWGIDATYKNSAGDAKAIKVIHDEQMYDPAQIYDATVANSKTQVHAKSDDVSDADNRATLIIGTTTYKVVDVKKDGTGLTTLTLSLD